MSIADIMPTVLEVSGATYPKEHNGHKLPPLIGKSWTQVLAGEAESPRSKQDYLAWELFGNRALIQGEWKLRWEIKPFGKSDWELFNLASDPAELNDLASTQSKKVQELVSLWDKYVRDYKVILPSRSPFEGLFDVLPPRLPVTIGYPPLSSKEQYVPPKNLMTTPKK
jgi:arylsulfatase